MGTKLELVYQYRQILGRCDAGTGLDIDEIGTLSWIEAQLGAPPPIGASDWLTADGPTGFPALLRGHRLDDEVTVVNLGPDGCVCRRAPYADEDALVELVVDQPDARQPDARQQRPAVSYRLKARVTWLQDDGDDYALGLSFVGVPVQVRYREVGALAQGNAPGRAAAA